MHRFPFVRSLVVLLFAGLPTLSGCGSGTAALVSGSGSGGGNAATVLSGFQLQGAKVSPATIAFTVVDEEADPARVELLYALPGEAPRAMTNLTALTAGIELDGNVATAASSANGVTHRLSWAFTTEAGLPGDGSFVPGAGILARIEGGTQGLLLGANADAQGLGNDAPMLLDPTPELAGGDEALGVVPVDFSVADSSSDPVDVLVEYAIVEPGQPLAWLAATPAGSEPNPIPGIETSPSPTVRTFFWDTNVDLAKLEHQVQLRFSPSDEVAAGTSVSTAEFRVDNNAAPTLTIQGDVLLSNEDERWGIPIPYRVSDPEGDPVEVVFQYRRPGEPFPELPSTKAEIDAILDSPLQRRLHNICTEYHSANGGRIVPVDEDTVRLPELGSSMAHLVATGIEGRILELLRPSSIPGPVADTWDENPLVRPVAALPLGNGLTALVLDSPSGGGWTLREIELATGDVVRSIVSSTVGSATAMCFERPFESAVLIASDVGGAWSVERVELSSGLVTPVASAGAQDPAGPVRGIGSTGTNAAVLTAGDHLLRLDYPTGAEARTSAILSGLVSPWGVAVDPRDASVAYVTERDVPVEGGRGRVLRVALDTHEVLPLALDTTTLGEPGFKRPEALAFERSGRRMVAVAQASGGGPRRLVGLDLGSAGTASAFPIGAPSVDDVVGVACGSSGVRLLALPKLAELAVGGGVEQRRRVEGFDPTGLDVHLVSAFRPFPRAFQPWRLGPIDSVVAPPGEGAGQRFVWNSADLAGGREAFFRAVSLDAEPGLPDETNVSRGVRSPFTADPLVLGGPGVLNSPRSVTAADLDADGDLDILSANFDSDDLTVFFQTAPGSFAADPLVLGGPGVLDGPVSVTAADIDADGDLDVLSANYISDDLTVFFQTAPGSFTADPLALGGPGVLDSPGSVTAADIDADGDLDILSANEGSDDLTLFLQTAPGSFAADPLVLGGPGVLNGPLSVAAADLDADGDLDILSANYYSDDLALFLQTTPGSFAADPLVLGGHGVLDRPDSVTAADLDADGDLDVLSANRNSNVLTVFFQTAPGSFAADPLVLGGPGVLFGPWSVTAADLDADGDLDILCANESGDDLTVFFQTAPGSFAADPLVLRGSGVLDGPVSVTAADLDADGDLDVLSANYLSDDLTVFIQTAPGSFAADPLALGGPGVIAGPQSVTAADLDADGSLDILCANEFGYDLTVFFQTAPGSFAADPLVLGGPGVIDGPRSVTAADLDADGDLDVLSASGNSNYLTLFFQTAPGCFAADPLVLGGPGVLSLPRSVAAADLDADGDLDVLTANYGSDDLTVFFQTGPGSFAADPLVLGGHGVIAGPRSVIAADLDADGDLDILSANEFSDDLTLFFQTAPGSFTADPLVLGGPGVLDGPWSVTAADLDADGDLDVLSANYLSDDLTLFFQTAPGSFAADPLVLGGHGVLDGPRSVAAADLDADGDLDVLSANTISDDLTVFFQTAPGSFAADPLVLGGHGVIDGPRSVIAADLDADGDLDVLSANESGDDLTVFYGGR